VGHVYIVRGVDSATGEAVSYTGSTIQDLRKRLGTHKWRQLIKAESTTIDIRRVDAEVDVKASGRGTMRSAKMEAARSAEEAVRRNVAKEPSRPLNEVRAAKGKHMEAWAERHNVRVAKPTPYKVAGGTRRSGPGAPASTVTESSTVAEVASEPVARRAPAAPRSPRGGVKPKLGGTAAGFLGLVLYDAFKMAREQELEKYVSGPMILEDEGGAFTFRGGGLFSPTFEKEYIAGESAGTVEPIDKKEFYELKEEHESLWGRVDWKGDFVPGKLRKELPVINPNSI
jgi:hypothetical protein